MIFIILRLIQKYIKKLTPFFIVLGISSYKKKSDEVKRLKQQFKNAEDFLRRKKGRDNESIDSIRSKLSEFKRKE
jgi:hypothetical protein